MFAPNPITKQVTKGRHIAARQIVLTNLSSLDGVVFKKTLDAIDDEQNLRDSFIYGDEIEKLSNGDEHAFSYQEKGVAKLLFDQYSGGSIHKHTEYADADDNTLYAQIEPYTIENDTRENIINLPDWRTEPNDVIALAFDGNVVGFLEVVGISGQSIADEYGLKYKLNKRDDLDYLFDELPSIQERL